MTSFIKLPQVIFGSTSLGNLYEAVSYEKKLAIVKACVDNAPDGIAMFDTAGKYGAGLALEVLGKCLKELNISKDKVIISNKLGWYQVPLTTPQPTFEKDIWIGINHDAVQKISYQGILDCFEQGNQLLGDYNSQMASIHDPDEYLAAAINKEDEMLRYNDILDAYKALYELKRDGKVSSIGVGAKNWKSIQRIVKDVQLDWVMIANSLSIKSHPDELIDFVKQLNKQGIQVINAAVFNGGFLVGGDFYNYKYVDINNNDGKLLHSWRASFFEVCKQYNIRPAEACVNFGLHIDGVDSIALSAPLPEMVATNVAMITKKIPTEFWLAMSERGLMEQSIPC